MSTELAPLQHFVGGEFRSFAGESTLPSVNPSRPSQVLGHFPTGGTESVNATVAAAAEAQKGWAALAGPQRADFLNRWADAIQARAKDLAEAVVQEVGKPIGEAKGEVGRCGMILRYFAGEAVRSVGDVIPAQVGGALQFTIQEPLGVVALITPWNFPLAIPLWKAAPALAMGNTVVLKPAEASSFVASLLAQTAKDAGLPAGVFNVLFGDGSQIGKTLMEHPEVRAVSFTGSDVVGSKVAAICAGRNIKFQTEMGGKNVGIVLADADMAQAANLVASGAMRYAGQKCTATSRVVVERSAREPFLSALYKAIDALPFGDPGQDATAIGPVITQRSHEFLLKTISEAPGERLYEGATVDASLKDGYFVPPTVFAVEDIQSDLAQKELFGPVLSVLEAENLDQAIEMANQVRFGLSASLFTKDLSSALKYVNRIQAGMVRVNADTTGVDPHAPFGGFKGSSSHVREQGPAAKGFYTETKTVQINP